MRVKCGVIGDPIAHSLSPLIHGAWLKEFKIDGSYQTLHVPSGELAVALKRFEAEQIHRVNVTLPHKIAALDLASSASDTASKIGAANTLTYTHGLGWAAENTDAPGFSLALLEALGHNDLAGSEIIVLGAGGASRGVVHALHQAGAKLTILNRTEARAEQLSSELTEGQARTGPLEAFDKSLRSDSVVINTASWGHQGDQLVLPNQAGALFFDISYGKAVTTQLEHAHHHGWQVQDGLGMLVAQAAKSFEIWFGHIPNRSEALFRCRNALKTTL